MLSPSSGRTGRFTYRQLQHDAMTDFREVGRLLRQLSASFDAAVMRCQFDAEDVEITAQRYDGRGSGGKGRPDPTALMALAAGIRDPVQRSGVKLMSLAHSTAINVSLMASLAEHLVSVLPGRDRRPTSEPCLVSGCGQNVSHSGFCWACYRSWCRWRQTRPGERSAFALWRAANIERTVKVDANEPLTRKDGSG